METKVTRMIQALKGLLQAEKQSKVPGQGHSVWMRGWGGQRGAQRPAPGGLGVGWPCFSVCSRLSCFTPTVPE